MAITSFKTDGEASEYIKVEMGQNDEFILDFHGAHAWGKASPNELKGLRVRTEADAGIGLNVDYALGRKRTFDTMLIAASASSTVFYIKDAIPSSNFIPGRRLYCRNETEDEVRACTYDPATRKVTITEAFGRIVLPADNVSFDHDEVLSAQPKTQAGSTASVLRLNSGGIAYVHVNYDIEIQLGSTRHVRRVTNRTVTRKERAGSANYNASAVDTANNTITIGTEANYRALESASTVYVANTGGYSGWSVGDILELRVTGGSERKFTVWTESGTQINFDGNGSPSNIQLRLTDEAINFTLDSALPSVPPNDTNVYVVSGQNFGRTNPLIEAASPSTTTVLFITAATWDSDLADGDDVIIDGKHYDISAVSDQNRRITLSTALPAAPTPGTEVGIGHSSDDFHDETTLSIPSTGTPRFKELTINHPISALKFASIGGASNLKTTIEVAGAGLPPVSERN